MKFTKEQWKSIGPWHFNDLPWDSTNQDFMLKVFNCMPEPIQADAVAWGASDSVFRDKVFEHLTNTQFGMTGKQFYENANIIGKPAFKFWKYEGWERLTDINTLSDMLVATQELGIIADEHLVNKRGSRGTRVEKIAQLGTEVSELLVEALREAGYKNSSLTPAELQIRSEEELGDILVMVFDIMKDRKLTESRACEVIQKGLGVWKEKHLK